MPVRPAVSRNRPVEALAVNLTAVAFFVGVIVSAFGLFMLIPMLQDLYDGNPDYKVFLTCSFVPLFIGSGLALASHHKANVVGSREVILAVPIAWLACVACGALPFVYSSLELSYTNAFFETMSGITATGSTVIIGLDDLPRGLLLWRFLLVWLGGFGVVTVAVFVLPFLRIGGMQMFVLDLSAQSGKFVPRMIDVVTKIASVYITLTILCAIAFDIEGMSTFDAIGHAMAAIATGGFSSHDASIGYFKSAEIEWTAALFMTFGALPFVLMMEAVRSGPRALLRDSQVQLFLLIICAASFTLTLWQVIRNDVTILQALREATFNVVSIISCTGFTSQDFNQWGPFPNLLLLFLMLAGGCTGSTSGGVKAFRIYILLQSVRAQIHRQIYPHGTFIITYNRQPVADTVRASVSSYFFIYISTFFLLTLALSLSGLSFESSLGASATALGGVGPGLGPVIGPCCTFTTISDPAKWFLAAGMLAGRLEILILVIPMTRTFWRT